MARPRRLSELVSSALARLALPDGPLVVALSGGADSAALALLCVEAGRAPRALHVDHDLAGSQTMESAARSIAATLGIELEVSAVSVPAGASPEGQARRARYQAFASGCHPGESLLTAHTLDDNAETILINLMRGTGPRGLGGIPYYRAPNIYRPALAIRRDETREMASLASLGFADDPMNADPALSRNWVRHTILPRLREANPRIAEALRRLGEAVGRDTGYLDDLASAESPALGEGSAMHPRARIVASPGPVADRVLMLMLGHVAGQDVVTSDRVERIWSVVDGETVSQEVGAGAVARLEGAMLVISLPDDESAPAGSELVPGTQRVGRLVFEVRRMTGACLVAPLSKWAAIFPADTRLEVRPDGVVTADGEPAWVPGERRLGAAWYRPGENGYLLVLAREGTGWT